MTEKCQDSKDPPNNYRVYPSHSPELERPLHSRVNRLSRSLVLSAEPL
jgi:hypothetical protein